MFLHSGASLHGHEYNTPPSPHFQQRKKPFLRSALPTPILRSSSSSSARENRLSAPAPSQRQRTVSELYTRPVSEIIPTGPVVRFKDPEPVVATPSSTFSMPEDDDPSVYDSDASASQATGSLPRVRRRRAAPRRSTAYVLAQPAPKLLSNKKNLFKNSRSRLLLQLQELATNQRPKPIIDVFPASVISGPLATARYINRFPRLFSAKGELGARDLILVNSEDYTAEGGDDDNSTAQRQPIAILCSGRGSADAGEIVLEDGKVWKWSCRNNNYSFVHNDESGNPVTVRWARRNPAKRTSSVSGPSLGALPNSSFVSGDSADLDYKYTFSIINPLVRRHPVLANLGPQSLEIYDDYMTPSSSSGRYPPSRPVSGISEPARSPPSSPLSLDEPSTRRETHPIDDETKMLIRVTGLWLHLRLGPSLDCVEPVEPSPSVQEPTGSMTTSSLGSITLPRRQTTSNTVSTPPPVQARGLRRAMSTGAAFMQRKKRQEPSDVPDRVTMELSEAIIEESKAEEGPPTQESQACTAQKRAWRLSWFKRTTH